MRLNLSLARAIKVLLPAAAFLLAASSLARADDMECVSTTF
jgi:hypothetical protein